MWVCDVAVIFFSFFFMAVPYGNSGLGVKLELQLWPYTTTTATLDLSHICNLCLSLWQCQILNSLSEVGD